MKELERIISPLKTKLNREIWLKFFLWCETLALFFVFLITIISKFVYIKHLYVFYASLLGVAFLVSIVLTFKNRMSVKKVALVYDSLGMKERFTTAIELSLDSQISKVGQMVVKDAIENGKNAKLEKKYKISLPKRAVKAMVFVLVAILMTGFIKNPEHYDVMGTLEKQIEEIEQVKKDINKEDDILSHELENLNREINSITKEIKTAVTKKDVLKALDEGQDELKKLEKSGSVKDIEAMSQALSDNSKTENLGKAMESSDINAAMKEMDALNASLEDLSQKELENLLEALKNATENLTNEELKEALENYTQSLAQGNFSNATNNLNNVKESLNQAMQSAQSTKIAIKNINNILAEATKAVETPDSLSQGQQNGQEGSEGSKANQSGSEGDSQGQTGGGQNGNEGVGQGQNGGEGQNGGQNGSGRGHGHVETEKIYSRPLSEEEGYNSQITGNENSGGETEIETHQTMAMAGESVPYREVLGEYSNHALKSLDESTIPYGMKDLVADYFSQLEK